MFGNKNKTPFSQNIESVWDIVTDGPLGCTLGLLGLGLIIGIPVALWIFILKPFFSWIGSIVAAIGSAIATGFYWLMIAAAIAGTIFLIFKIISGVMGWHTNTYSKQKRKKQYTEDKKKESFKEALEALSKEITFALGAMEHDQVVDIRMLNTIEAKISQAAEFLETSHVSENSHNDLESLHTKFTQLHNGMLTKEWCNNTTKTYLETIDSRLAELVESSKKKGFFGK